MRFPAPVAASALLSVLALTGCSVMGTTAADSTLQGAAIQGEAHGGSQAIVGARVYLLAATTTSNPGYTNTASTSLLNSTTVLLAPYGGGTDSVGSYVLTGSYGQFSITGDYSCTTGQEVYLLVLGGNPGVAGTTNANIGLMTVLGTCPSGTVTAITPNFLGTVPYLYVNEVTTVAAAYAMAGYATDAEHVFTSGNALATTGLANAFANFANLANVATGVANTVTPGNTNSMAPQTTINTLANILASCVNSRGVTGGNSSGTNCTTLFTNAKSGGTSGTTPTETATAAINMAHNPGANVANLYALQAGVGAPFSPSLGSAPTDLTVALSFGGTFDYPTALAIDGSGSVWIADQSGNGVTELNASGSLVGVYAPSGSNFSGPNGIAIDGSGNVWVTNSSNTVTRLDSTGASATNYTSFAPSGSYFSTPNGIAIDGFGNAWVVNKSGNSVTELTDSGGLAGYFTNYAPNGSNFNAPFAIAFDGSGNVWVPNEYNNSVTELTGSGGLVGNYSTSNTSGSNFNYPQGVAIDGSGDVWVASFDGNSVTELSGFNSPITPTHVSGTAYAPSGSNFNYPGAIAIDGSGNAWVTNNGGSVTELTGSGILAGNYAPSGSNFSNPNGIAIDGSGNAWVANAGNNTVTELVGSATPVVTPLAANLIPTGSGGQYGGNKAVNRP